MICIERKKLGILVLVLVLAIIGTYAGYTILHANTPVRIGVLLPLTGDVEFREPLEWAKDTINSEGGIGGRQIELVYKDTGSGNTSQLAQELLNEDSIHFIIGPESSDEVFELAPAFIEKKKVLISPTATSGDIIRAYGKNGYVWRTTQGDAAQVKTILTILKGKGVTRVALFAENSTYGQTFYDWTGFFATEYGIDVTSIEQFDPGSPTLATNVAEALKTNPQYLIAVCDPGDAAVIKRTIDSSGSRTKLFLTDSSATPALISQLGSAAEGIEGTNPTADPTAGFVEAYREKFSHDPADFAAPTYDALLIAAYSTQRQEATYMESLPDSVRKVVYGDGIVTSWNATGVRTALQELKAGRLPWITGASGGLEYDEEVGVDQIYTYYSNWAIQNGTFKTLGTYASAELDNAAKNDGTSVGLSTGSAGLMSSAMYAKGSPETLAQKKNFVAVIVGPSQGWKNYRHQADALTIYQLLKNNGIDDDHIILMSFDDVPTDPQNPIRGDIHNIPKGINIRNGAQVDYSGKNVTAETLANVLTGTKTDTSPIVLESDRNTDVFVYVASHGSPGEINFRMSDEFTTSMFTDVTNTMYKNGRYRQLFFMDDSCFGESIATNATAPGILYLTGAAKNEPSLGAVYDSNIKQWLSDEFTVNVVDTLQMNPNITFRELYPTVYNKVTGSHVRMITTGNFSLDVPVLEFFKP